VLLATLTTTLATLNTVVTDAIDFDTTVQPPMLNGTALDALNANIIQWDGGPAPSSLPPTHVGVRRYFFFPVCTLLADIITKTVGGVYACTDIYWTGNCFYNVYPSSYCIIMPLWLNNTISSISPDPGTLVRQDPAELLFIVRTEIFFLIRLSPSSNSILVYTLRPAFDSCPFYYSSGNCTGAYIALVIPGTPNLNGIGWGDKVSSFVVQPYTPKVGGQ